MPAPSNTPTSLFEKLWTRHVVLEKDGGQTLLYIDRHYLGDDLPPETFGTLKQRRIPIRRPEATFAMPDHYAPTHGRALSDVVDDERRVMIQELTRHSRDAGITLFPLDDPRQGIVHVVGPEQGLSLPGMSIVCGDSHTATHGALGALAFGIGASEVAHVLATQTLWQLKPGSMRIRVDGAIGSGVTAKDLILAIIRQIGSAGAAGHAIEYVGTAINALSVEGRMTLCNMSIEAGARAGMIAPDQKVLAYLAGRPYSPAGDAWTRQAADWMGLRSDTGAVFDREAVVDAAQVAPMVSWGTNPAQSCSIAEHIPTLDSIEDDSVRQRVSEALRYMDLAPGAPISGTPVDRVFIGSCTNGRIEDLRLAASVANGRRVRVPTWVVPGSGLVRQQAEAEGLDRIFLEAGMEWRQPGCSMCLAINGDVGRPGERCVSTTNRNFVGRQGQGVRTHLANPGMATAAAITGRLTDYRELAHANL